MESVLGLEGLPGIRAGFIGRIPGIDVDGEREEVLARLWKDQRDAADREGFEGMPFAIAEQVHGNLVVPVDKSSTFPVPGADGLITTTPGLCLAIYVADCAAVYLADRKGRAIGLVHSGKKGTEQQISVKAVEALQQSFGVEPGDLIASISPCIRPPHYEWDFSAEIVRQLQEAGVSSVSDDRTCTASFPERYYSYRREKGRTGRMLALLAIAG